MKLFLFIMVFSMTVLSTVVKGQTLSQFGWGYIAEGNPAAALEVAKVTGDTNLLAAASGKDSKITNNESGNYMFTKYVKLLKVSKDTTQLQGLQKLQEIMKSWSINGSGTQFENARVGLANIEKIANNFKTDSTKYVWTWIQKKSETKNLEKAMAFFSAIRKKTTSNKILYHGQELHRRGDCEEAMKYFKVVGAVGNRDEHIDARIKMTLIYDDWGMKTDELLLLANSYNEANDTMKVLILGNLAISYPIRVDDQLVTHGLDTLNIILSKWVTLNKRVNSKEFDDAMERYQQELRWQKEFNALREGAAIEENNEGDITITKKRNGVTEITTIKHSQIARKGEEYLFSKHIPVCREDKPSNATWDQVHAALRAMK